MLLISWWGAKQKTEKRVEAQVQQECGLTAAPVDTGYKHLYELEVNRRTHRSYSEKSGA